MKKSFKKYANYYKSLFISKTRVYLTILGMTISMVIFFLGVLVIDTYTYSIKSNYDNISNNLTYIINKNGFTDTDLFYFSENLNSTISYYTSSYSSNIIENDYEYSVNVVGTTSNFYTNFIETSDLFGSTVYNNPLLEKREWFIGDTWTMQDIANSNRVVVINEFAVDLLFNGSNPIGKYMEINFLYYRVIGVISNSSVTNKYLRKKIIKDSNHLVYPTVEVYMPTTTFFKYYSLNRYTKMIVDGDINYTNNFISYYNNNIDTENVIVIDKNSINQDIRKMMREFLPLIVTIILFASIVSFLIVLNIMLFNVKEKIPEFGIRLALGARKKDIILQILFEGILYIVLSLFLGFLIFILLTKAFELFLSVKNFSIDKIYFEPFHIFLASIFMCLMYLVISSIPAIYSSKMKVIDAIKFE